MHVDVSSPSLVPPCHSQVEVASRNLDKSRHDLTGKEENRAEIHQALLSQLSFLAEFFIEKLSVVFHIMF